MQKRKKKRSPWGSLCSVAGGHSLQAWGRQARAQQGPLLGAESVNSELRAAKTPALHLLPSPEPQSGISTPFLLLTDEETKALKGDYLVQVTYMISAMARRKSQVIDS